MTEPPAPGRDYRWLKSSERQEVASSWPASFVPAFYPLSIHLSSG